MPATIDLQQNLPVDGELDEAMPCITADVLSKSPDRSLIEALRRTCVETGFFCIEMNARQREAIDRTLDSMQRFFAIADDDAGKQRVISRDGSSGWTPRYSEPAYQPGTISKLEAFDFGIDELPDTEFWPGIPNFADAATGCWQEYITLADNVLRALALAAGLESGFLNRNCDSRELNTMRLLYYAAEHARSSDSSVGIAAHTDFECITLLYQTAPGLELFDATGRWIDAPVSDGRLIVMLGDMLERWTNGYFKATGHRVRDTDQRRFSIVMFVAANDGVTIEPQNRFVSDASPVRYAPVTQLDHIETEVQRARENAERQKMD
jgi:isopenicillin N synthase-like dioxygenase